MHPFMRIHDGSEIYKGRKSERAKYNKVFCLKINIKLKILGSSSSLSIFEVLKTHASVEVREPSVGGPVPAWLETVEAEQRAEGSRKLAEHVEHARYFIRVVLRLISI